MEKLTRIVQIGLWHCCWPNKNARTDSWLKLNQWKHRRTKFRKILRKWGEELLIVALNTIKFSYWKFSTGYGPMTRIKCSKSTYLFYIHGSHAGIKKQQIYLSALYPLDTYRSSSRFQQPIRFIKVNLSSCSLRPPNIHYWLSLLRLLFNSPSDLSNSSESIAKPSPDPRKSKPM